MQPSKAKDYVICVSGTPGPCWLALPCDEDEPGTLATTSDPQLALRFTDFVEARSMLRENVKLHQHRSFKLDLMAPEWTRS
ncbi:MAG: hypothetical protein Q8R67_12305 [Rhodoferax sp.]|nr:hypothetical protein [Rhodoferax sp.]MDP3652455.1 hypothetical protein [Rhodoferax sp.]